LTFSTSCNRLLKLLNIMEGEKIEDTIVTRQIPIVAIRGSVVFPYTDAVLSFGRKKSVEAVNAAFQQDRIVAIFTQKDAKTTEAKMPIIAITTKSSIKVKPFFLMCFYSI